MVPPMLATVPSSPFLEYPLDVYPPLPESDLKHGVGEFDNQSTSKLPPIPDEDLAEPMKKLTVCTNK